MQYLCDTYPTMFNIVFFLGFRGCKVTYTLPVVLFVRNTKSPTRPEILSIPGINVTFAILLFVH